jgi:hypothetical protein
MPKYRQELYKVATHADGRAVREDDAEPELLEDSTALEDGEMVTLAVKEEPWVWQIFSSDRVALSEQGALATHYRFGSRALVTSALALNTGRHYWEVDLCGPQALAPLGRVPAVGDSKLYIGVARRDLDMTGNHHNRSSNDGWFVSADNGGLYGNGKAGSSKAGRYLPSIHRVGILLDLNDGSLLFFKNGVQHGPGYPAGSVTGPVVAAVQMKQGHGARLLPNAAWPDGQAR